MQNIVVKNERKMQNFVVNQHVTQITERVIDYGNIRRYCILDC